MNFTGPVLLRLMWTCFFMLFVAGRVVIGQQTNTSSQSASSQPASQSALQPAAHSEQTATKDQSPIIDQNPNPRLKYPITLWAKESSLSDVLKVLSERSEMNFVAGQGVQREKITILLNKTPLDEAIDILVRAAGLSYEIIGNSVLIAEPDKLKGEVGNSSYVIELKYADANEVVKLLSDLSKNIKVDEGGNRLICYTSPRVIREIERVVKSIDHPHVLVVLETRLVEVSMNDVDKYGIDWGKLVPLQSTITYPSKPLTNAFEEAKFVQLPLNYTVVLDMLLDQGKAKLLMDSRLATTNNREAKLHIGEKIPYVIQTFNNQGQAGGANMQIQKEEVGVIIKMTPHINEKNQITLTLEPEVSSITDWRGPNRDIPLVRIRKTVTTLRVEDNQPIIIAGLLSEEKTVGVKKLPLLGQIPFLGYLFQSRREEIKKTNLVVEITPHIIQNLSEMSFKELMQRDATEKQGSLGIIETELEKKTQRSSSREPIK